MKHVRKLYRVYSRELYEFTGFYLLVILDPGCCTNLVFL
jgi:hypothetical protein